MIRHTLLLISLLSAFSLAGQSTEVIHRFDATIDVRVDGTLTVHETIDVTTAGKLINRGITRAITRKPIGGYDGERFDYEAVEVHRDGLPIDYFEKSTNRLQTFYLGSKDITLPPGRYTYDFIYTSEHQIYAEESIEEIRWHLIDSETQLAVETASVTVNFPPSAPVRQYTCYTGPAGSTASDCDITAAGNAITFKSQGTLVPGEAFTVSVGAPTGSFALPPPPPQWRKRLPVYIIIAGLSVAFFYGKDRHDKYGRDPIVKDKGLEFYPPNELSPAAAVFCSNHTDRSMLIAASLADLSLKGYLTVEESHKKGFLGIGAKDYYTLIKTDRPPGPDLPREQAALYEDLFSDAYTIELDGKYNATVAEASRNFSQQLSRRFKDYIYEGHNLQYIWPLVLILLATFGLAGCYLTAGPVVLSFFVVTLVAAIGALIWYVYLIAQPSEEKVDLIQRLDRFKEALQLSRSQRSEIPDAPEMTESYYRNLFPYAMAFGADTAWGQNLDADWFNTSTTGQQYAVLYGPTFATRMKSNVATTAYDSSSDSGSGGGGFSGGGGGAGGGGGGTGGF